MTVVEGWDVNQKLSLHASLVDRLRYAAASCSILSWNRSLKLKSLGLVLANAAAPELTEVRSRSEKCCIVTHLLLLHQTSNKDSLCN